MLLSTYLCSSCRDLLETIGNIQCFIWCCEPWVFGCVRSIQFLLFYVLVFKNSAMIKMMKQRKRTQMICTNRWLQTQTIYLISLVIFVKIPVCIGKETLYVCSNMFFYVHFQTMILQEKLISAKNATKWYVTCLYLTKLIFRHLANAPLWKRGWNWVSSHGKHGAFFVGDLDTLGKLCAKYQLYIFFPQKM